MSGLEVLLADGLLLLAVLERVLDGVGKAIESLKGEFQLAALNEERTAPDPNAPELSPTAPTLSSCLPRSVITMSQSS